MKKCNFIALGRKVPTRGRIILPKLDNKEKYETQDISSMTSNEFSGFKRRISMIRKATINDAKEFCQVLCISITELCKKDYENNDKILEKWLSNKTIENCKKWILDNKN